MATTDKQREEELRGLLTDAIEVQIAALKAGIGFWGEWIEQTSGFVQAATERLSAINAGDQNTQDVLLGLLDAGRSSARSMTEIPRHTAQRFLDELDARETSRSDKARRTNPAAAGVKKRARQRTTRRKRRARAKA